MEYKASLDTVSKVLTIAVILLFTAIGIRLVFGLTPPNEEGVPIAVTIGMLALFVAIIAGSYAYSLRGYEVTADSLLIRRRLNTVTIPLNEIEEIRLVESGEMKSLIRTFGNGGLFGYYGKFYSPSFGHMTFYATNTKNKVLIRTKAGKKIIITPDDLSMAAELQRKK